MVSCTNQSSKGNPAVRDAALSPIGSASPIDDVKILDGLLRAEGLHIDSSTSLPGTDKLAFVITVPGKSAINAWAAARSLVSQTGRYPVILGGSGDFGGKVSTASERTLDAAKSMVETSGLKPESVLTDALALDLDQWFESRAKYLEISAADLEATRPLPQYNLPKDRFATNTDILSQKPLPEVEIVLLPTQFGWEAPAYLMWGGWNDTPLPHELVAIFKRWSDTNGAEVVAMTGDVVEMTVVVPPTDDLSAIKVAQDQFLVAPDIVWQGTGDVGILASAVRDASVWYFWWD
jgi:hypothetical protein